MPKIIIRGLWFSWWGWNLGGGGGERLSATMIESEESRHICGVTIHEGVSLNVVQIDSVHI